MLKALLLGTAAILALAALGLVVLRFGDALRDRRAWAAHLARQPAAPAVFTPDLVANLPDPARRYFLDVIRPGTPLRTVAEIDMAGQFSLGSRDNPNYGPMRAEQILAPPYGFVWKMRSGMIGGSDGMDASGTWLRFRLFGLVPVARAGGPAATHPDEFRSTLGRVAGEAVAWAPAALLPGDHVRWEQVSDDTARVIVSYRGVEQPVEITVAEDGRPVSMVMPRWSNANPARVWQIQPFGGEISEFRTFGGCRLPTRVDGGNFYGTPDYFPFFRAEVTDIRFPAPE